MLSLVVKFVNYEHTLMFLISFVCLSSAINPQNRYLTSTTAKSKSYLSQKSGKFGENPRLKCLTASHRRTMVTRSAPGEEDPEQGRRNRLRRSTGVGGILDQPSSSEGSVVNVVYFDLQTDLLYYRHLHSSEINFPSERFSLELWVKPEGGQVPGAVIAEFSDKCRPYGDWGWTVGIGSPSLSTDGSTRYFFRVKTDRSLKATVIGTHTPYRENQWTHIVVTYDSFYQYMYINGALVAKGHGQRGSLFSPVTFSCKQLTIGGSGVRDAQFRGMLDNFILTPKVYSHEEVIQYFNKITLTSYNSSIVEEFDSLENWESFDENYPRLMTSSTNKIYNLQLAVPPCGKTVCDNEDLIAKYNTDSMLRHRKVIKYRYITVMDDDGADHLELIPQINRQHRLVQMAFKTHNLSWDLSVHRVYNTTLGRKKVMVFCREEQIGDGRCDGDCNSLLTGFDGGDCISFDVSYNRRMCMNSMIADNICHDDCNFARFHYDGGDCCDIERSDTSHCRDPTSSERAFISLNRYKESIGLDSSSYLNIYVVAMMEDDTMGFAAYPWHSEALTMYGGTVINIDALKFNNTIVHELGHNLGLWHTHHGVSEVSCADKCRETRPSMTLGDFVKDTKPTPENLHCHDPVYGEYRVCDFDQPLFKDTPFRNYMSSADDSCVSEFTPQQVARMHCYVDLAYSSWRNTNIYPVKPILPFPPTIVQKVEHKWYEEITLAWLPPLGDLAPSRGHCSNCEEDGSLRLFASSAEFYQRSIKLDDIALYALGPPDAERCSRDNRTWYPPYPSFLMCYQRDCYLELSFEYPILATRLSIWVAYSPTESTMDIDLVLEDESVVSLGQIHVSCEVPYTHTLEVRTPVEKIRLYMQQPYGFIDSVQLESPARHSQCVGCSTLYLLSREPHFHEGNIMMLTENQFVDSIIYQDGVEYNYSVRAVSGLQPGNPTSVTQYTVGKAFCGDGIINAEEECDDGNVSSGDGCNLQCKVEDFFVCKGQPSLCRYYRDDGECEPFELTEGAWPDCGHVTPTGHSDQWVAKAVITQDNVTKCDPLKLIGPAPLHRTCRVFGDEESFNNELSLSLQDAWSPCDVYAVEISFDVPVVATTLIIHLAALVDYDDFPVRVTISLIDPEGIEIRPKAADRLVLSCEDNPIHISIYQDLSYQFQYTKYVRLSFNRQYVAIYGIRLRNSLDLNPVAIGSCREGGLYNRATQSCGDYRQYIPRCRDISDDIRNSNTTCSGFMEGDVCYVTCDVGYRPSKTINLLCARGNWQNIEEAVCKPVVCAEPSIANAVTSCPNGMTYKKRCSFKCVVPAKLKGHENSNEIFCQDDGLFSLPQAFCQLLCDAPSIPSYSYLLSKLCNRGGQVVGTKCKFRCATGYMTDRTTDTGVSRTFYHQCSRDLSWTGPTCRRIRCPLIPGEFDGKYECTDVFFYDSDCTMTCLSTEPQLITCSKLGTWSGQFHTCPE